MIGNLNSNWANGIFGQHAGSSGGSAEAKNCYFVGTLKTGGNGKGITINNNDNLTIKNCYTVDTLNGEKWDDVSANQSLNPDTIHIVTNSNKDDFSGNSIHADNSEKVFIDYSTETNVPYKLYWQTDIELDIAAEPISIIKLKIQPGVNIIYTFYDGNITNVNSNNTCLLYTSPSPRD